MTPATTVLGIDPGLETTGYALIAGSRQRPSILETGLIRTGGARRPLEERLLDLHTSLIEVMELHHPAAMAIEEIFSHPEFPRTAILMGHARGVIALVAAQHGVPVFNYAATRVKSQLTGNGHAGKADVQRAVASRLFLAKPPSSDHVADALALALCHRDALGGLRETAVAAER